ncbi:hypothetical protein D3C72_1293290 [compost metagenome]
MSASVVLIHFLTAAVASLMSASAPSSSAEASLSRLKRSENSGTSPRAWALSFTQALKTRSRTFLSPNTTLDRNALSCASRAFAAGIF